jgi:hypothetical protein
MTSDTEEERPRKTATVRTPSKGKVTSALVTPAPKPAAVSAPAQTPAHRAAKRNRPDSAPAVSIVVDEDDDDDAPAQDAKAVASPAAVKEGPKMSCPKCLYSMHCGGDKIKSHAYAQCPNPDADVVAAKERIAANKKFYNDKYKQALSEDAEDAAEQAEKRRLKAGVKAAILQQTGMTEEQYDMNEKFERMKRAAERKLRTMSKKAASSTPSS